MRLFEQPTGTEPIRPKARSSRWRESAFVFFLVIAIFLSWAQAAQALLATVEYQPMVANGLATGQAFEAWIVLDKPLILTRPAIPRLPLARNALYVPKSLPPASGSKTRSRASLRLATEGNSG